MPSRWYWLSPKGDVYSSASNSIVPITDKVYQNWLTFGNVPTVWPFDASRNQTVASLNAVLEAFSLPDFTGTL